MPITFPLATDAFRAPLLDRAEKHRWIGYGQQICHETVLNALTMQEAPLKALVTSQTTQRTARIRQGHDVVQPLLDGVCAYTQVSSTIEEVADFFYLNSHEKLHAYGTVTGQTILDHQSVYTLLDRNAASSRKQPVNPLHYVAIDWIVTKTPLFFANRDACYIECHDEFEFVDAECGEKRRGFVRATSSINLDCVPSLKASHGLVRSHHHRSGYIFFETDDPNTLDLFSVVVVAPHKHMPRLATLSTMQRHCARSLNLEEFLQARRVNVYLQQCIFESVENYEPKDHVSCCRHCQKKFHLFLPKKHCRKCGQVVCTSCSKRWDLLLRQSNKVSVRVCTACVTDGLMPYCGRTPSSIHSLVTPHLHFVPWKASSSSVNPAAPPQSTMDIPCEDFFDLVTDTDDEKARVRRGIVSFCSSSKSLQFSSKESCVSSVDGVSLACHPGGDFNY
ncbi:Aste57867_22198 [Aphanomyces stellatus]|uniref:Aste57867_22198 protein n=1 Tax=Aphanomyces stellatus TaxID=120398 RepID=A0A485LKC9_9STRA|nr:hypothetical protein As57867_022129 [Aphanomyces stellatus]VFT98865.1 Aste57867_22198 [Aphanomyces stellatus]